MSRCLTPARSGSAFSAADLNLQIQNETIPPGQQLEKVSPQLLEERSGDVPLQRAVLFSICNGRNLAHQPLWCTWIKAGLGLSRDFNFSFSLNIPKDQKGRKRRINETTTLLMK